MTDLKALLERVMAASGPSRKIDAILWSQFVPRNLPDCLPDVKARIVERILNGGDDQECPPYTASIDAALDLVEKVLPGCDWMMCPGTFTMCRNWNDDYAPTFRSHDHPKREHHESFTAWSIRRKRTHQDGPKTTPLAILAALLKSQLPNE